MCTHELECVCLRVCYLVSDKKEIEKIKFEFSEDDFSPTFFLVFNQIWNNINFVCVV